MVPQCIALATTTTEPVTSITPIGFRSTWACIETIGMAVVDFWKFVPNGSFSLSRRVSAAPILFQFGNLHEFVTCVGAQPTHASTPNVTPNNLENYYSLYLSPEQTASEPKIPRGYLLW
jgi:hypothetical protein